MKWLGVLALCVVIIAAVSLSLFTVARQFARDGERTLASEAASAGRAAFAGPEPGRAGDGIVTTAVMANAPGSFRFAAAGDLGGTETSTTSFAALARAKPDFFLAIGDLSYGDIAPESAWCSYVQEHLGATYPFELLVGNHEQSPSSDDGFIDNFARCLPGRLGEKGHYAHRYYFDYPADDPIARFIFIDPDLPRGSADAQYCKDGEKSNCNWLKARIDEAQSKGLWTIVSMHKVCVTAGEKSCEIGAELFNLLLERKVDLVLQGHEHGYQRSKQLSLNADCPALKPNNFNASCVSDDGSDGVYRRGAGPVIVISAAFGRDPYTVHPDDPEALYIATWMDRDNESKGYMQFTVTKDKIDGQFVTVTGPLTDHLTISGTAVVSSSDPPQAP
jgi:hypothetical protein